MNAQDFIARLFEGYQDSATLRDFQEELLSNLEDRIKDLEAKGMGSEEAFSKATGELGDISQLAEQLSLEKKKEVYADMYMKTRNYMTTKRVVAYVAAGGLFAFGIICAILAYLGSRELWAIFGTGIAFGIPSICAFAFLGLTQETASHNPMSFKRAAWYMPPLGTLLFGLCVTGRFALVWEGDPMAAVGTLIPFVLPAGVMLAFLILTEKNRQKPWVLEQQKRYAYDSFGDDPAAATRFGLMCGALWLFAVALFFALGFLFTFRYSWLVFLFALPLQLVIQVVMTPKKSN